MSASGRKAYTQKARYGEVFMADRGPKRQKLNNDSMTISFGEEDREAVLYLHEDALVINLLIFNCKMRRVLVDNKSSTDILLWEAFTKMGIDAERLRPPQSL